MVHFHEGLFCVAPFDVVAAAFKLFSSTLSLLTLTLSEVFFNEPSRQAGMMWGEGDT